MTITILRHNKIDLSLHRLRDGVGRSLLLLHGLGESSPQLVPEWAAGWAGPIVALDFTGHGGSTIPAGGGYTAEIVLADADVALAELGTATLVGRGLGAYVALMLAGARPQLVRGAVLCDGPGLAGGAIGPTSQSFVTLSQCWDSSFKTGYETSAPPEVKLVATAGDANKCTFTSAMLP